MNLSMTDKDGLLMLKKVAMTKLPEAQCELYTALAMKSEKYISECREHVREYKDTVAAVNEELERRRNVKNSA